MARIEAALASVAVRAHRRPAATLLAAALLAGLASVGASRLRLDNDLAALLPASFESVQGFEKLREKFGGVGYVAVAGYDADRAGLERFAEDLAPRLEALPGIRFVEWRRESPFFEERALYYLSLDDLGEIARRVKAREKYERRQRNPMYIELDQEEVPSLDFSDIEGKYAGASSRRLSGDERYYLDPGQRMVVLMAKPAGNSLDLDFSLKVVAEVEQLIAGMDLGRYGPTFKVQLTGAYKKKVDGQAQIVRDVARSSLVALVLLLGYLLIHFRSVVAVVMTLAPVGAGLLWTYGIVGAAFGTVNLLTAFAGAILGGLSVEHGIHLLARYESLRAAGASSERATGEAFSHTGSAALIAALVAALTFLSLAVSKFRVFREFGMIAAFGMLVAIVAYVLVLPALLGIASRHGWRPSPAITGRGSQLARWLLRPRFRQSVVVVTGLALAALLWNARHARFDFDISALEDASMPSFVFDKTTNRLLGYSQTPVVVLTPDPQSERAVVDELNRRKRQRGAASGVDFVAALDDLVPQQQAEKQQILASMAEVLGRVKRDALAPDQRARFDELATMVAARPFTRAELPVGVRRQFLGIDQGQTGFVLVFPSISLSDGARVRELAKEVRSIELPGGGRLSAAGEAMMLADIIDMVAHEMPLIFGAALVSILLTMAVTLGSLKLAVLCMSPTLVSILALLGLVPACDLAFNYLNVIVLTVLIGVTVDAGVHMVSRLTTPGEDFVAVYGETGRAIAGGILTSALGFGAMWLADHPGLQSVGKLANLGFATNLLVMLLAFPAVALPFIVRGRRRPDPAPVALEDSGLEQQRLRVGAGGQGGG
jgi:predicted RND superfamily exporter protein